LEDRTSVRYDNARLEELMEHISASDRGRELEQIAHEEDPLKILDAFEAEGWTPHLFPGWTRAVADTEKLADLHQQALDLQVQGVHADVSIAQMQLLTAKLTSSELSQLKTLLLRPGFVQEWNQLDAQAAEFAKVLLSKENSSPSATYQLFMSYAAEAILWLGFTSKQSAVKEQYENFLKNWPLVRQKIPYALMLEMRITPELPGYSDLVKSIFLDLIDGKLTTIEEIRALLEPHSPPAPPPPVTIKRTRAKKSADAKAKSRIDDDDDVDAEDSDTEEDDEDEDEDLDGLDLDSEDLDFSIASDDVRAVLPVSDGEEEDVFARDSVGDDLDPDGEGDSDEDEDGESANDDDPDDDGPSGIRKKAGSSLSARDVKSAGKRKSSAKLLEDDFLEDEPSLDSDDSAEEVKGPKKIKQGAGKGSGGHSRKKE